MEFTYEQYCRSADAVRRRLDGFVPKAALILGSGLGYLAD